MLNKQNWKLIIKLLLKKEYFTEAIINNKFMDKCIVMAPPALF